MSNFIKNIKDCYEGMMVTCKIKGEYLSEARLAMPKETYIYICQNKFEGNSTKNRYAFCYSWAVNYNKKTGLIDWTGYNVSDLQKDPDSDKLILTDED